MAAPQPLSQRPRMIPTTDQRVVMKVTEEARETLRRFLYHEMDGTGMGYSEFIRQSVALWRELEP